MRRLIWTFTAALLAGPPAGAEQASPAPAQDTDVAPDEPEVVDDSRLMLAPTGRPLRKDTGYFSNHYLFFSGFSYGVTDNVSLSAGVSMFPGLGPGGQLFYVSPRIGKRFSDRLAASAGVFYLRVPWDDDGHNVGLGSVMATLGGPDASLSAGVGAFRTTGRRDLYGPHFEYLGSETSVSYRPILILGGEKRLSKHVACIAESWLAFNGRLSETKPLGLALRLSGDSLSADLGVVLAPASPTLLPWVSVSYHFGPPARR